MPAEGWKLTLTHREGEQAAFVFRIEGEVNRWSATYGVNGHEGLCEEVWRDREYILSEGIVYGENVCRVTAKDADGKEQTVEHSFVNNYGFSDMRLFRMTTGNEVEGSCTLEMGMAAGFEYRTESAGAEIGYTLESSDPGILTFETSSGVFSESLPVKFITSFHGGGEVTVTATFTCGSFVRTVETVVTVEQRHYVPEFTAEIDDITYEEFNGGKDLLMRMSAAEVETASEGQTFAVRVVDSNAKTIYVDIPEDIRRFFSTPLKLPIANSGKNSYIFEMVAVIDGQAIADSRKSALVSFDAEGETDIAGLVLEIEGQGEFPMATPAIPVSYGSKYAVKIKTVPEDGFCRILSVSPESTDDGLSGFLKVEKTDSGYDLEILPGSSGKGRTQKLRVDVLLAGSTTKTTSYRFTIYAKPE